MMTSSTTLRMYLKYHSSLTYTKFAISHFPRDNTTRIKTLSERERENRKRFITHTEREREREKKSLAGALAVKASDMEENEHLLPGSPPREISSSSHKKRGSWFVKVLLVSLFLSLALVRTVGFLSSAVHEREDETQNRETKTKMILMKFLSLGDAGGHKAKEEKNGFKIRFPFVGHHVPEKPRETSEKRVGPINEDLVKVMEENAKKRLSFKAGTEAREGPARGLDDDESIVVDGESVGENEQRRVSSPRAAAAVSVSSSSITEDGDDDDSNVAKKRSPREQRRQRQQTNTNTKKNVQKAKNTNKEVPNYKSQAEANLRMIPTSLFDLFKSKEYEEEEKEEKSYFENNAKCENVFTLGLEGVGHHAFQMGKDAFVKTLLRAHLGNVEEKKTNGNNNNNKDIVEMHAREEDRMFIDNDDHFWNLILENKYDEIFKTFRKGCEEVAKKNGNEKTACYSTRSFSFPHKLGPFATGSGLDVNHAQRWDPRNPEHRKYLFDHGHPINILKYFEAAERNGCQVKFILLHRNIVETARSHKTWDQGLEKHLNVLKMFAEYIDVSLANLPSNSWRRVNYEDFWRPHEERDRIFQTLATDFLHWSSDAHESFMNSQFDLNVHPRKYKTNDKPPCDEVRELDRVQRNFFDRKLTSYSKREKHVTNLPLSHFFTESPNKALYEQCWEASKASLLGKQ